MRLTSTRRAQVIAAEDRLVFLLATDLLGRRLWCHRGTWLVRDGQGQWCADPGLRDTVIADMTQGYEAIGEGDWTVALWRNTRMLNRNRELLIRLRDYQIHREVPAPEDLPDVYRLPD